MQALEGTKLLEETRPLENETTWERDHSKKRGHLLNSLWPFMKGLLFMFRLHHVPSDPNLISCTSERLFDSFLLLNKHNYTSTESLLICNSLHTTMAENGDRRDVHAEQGFFNSRESTPVSDLGTPELSSSSSTVSDRSEPQTPTDSQPLPLPLPLPLPRIATNSGPRNRSATPLSQSSDNEENRENDNGEGNEDVRDDVTVAGSLASSEGHAWPFGTSREPTPATNDNRGEDDTSEAGSDMNNSQFERSQAPTPSSHMPTPRERTPAAERRSRGLNALEEGAEEGAIGDEEQSVDQDVDMEVLDSIETEEGNGGGDDAAVE